MRIYMQTQPGADKVLRFYHLHLQKDLLGGWTLIRESGQQGAPGKVTREHFDLHEDALNAITTWRDKQISRGFTVVFVEGTNAQS